MLNNKSVFKHVNRMQNFYSKGSDGVKKIRKVLEQQQQKLLITTNDR